MTSLVPRSRPEAAVRRSQLLRPRSSPNLLDRPRLRELLDRGAQVPMTVVVAPAGYGKTTLVSTWVATSERRCAWVSLDTADSNIRVFTSKLMAAIQTVVPEVGVETHVMLFDSGELAPEALAATLADELISVPDDLVVVLDDYHAIAADSDVHAFVDGLLSYPPPGLRVIITSRTAPRLSLDSHRIHGTLHEVGVADLAFTADETRAYLQNVLHEEPSPSFVNQVIQKSEGWATMLHLSCLVAARSPIDADDARLLAAARRHAVAYLGVNLVDSLSDEHRDFLLRIAVPERVTASLAAEITDDLALRRSAERLLELTHTEGLFLISFGEDGRWYRFHPVFREFLLERLAEEVGQDGLRALHLRTAAWFERQGDIDDAIEHALLGGDGDLAARIVVQYAQVAMTEDRWLEFERWLRLLPGAVVESNFDLVLIRGWLHQITGRYDFMEVTVRDAETLLVGLSERVPENAVYRAEVDLLRMHLHMPAFDSAEQREAAARVYERLRDTDRYPELMAIHVRAEQLGMHDPAAAVAFLDDIVARNAQRSGRFSKMRVLIARSAGALLATNHGDVTRVGDLGHQIIAGAEEIGSLRMRAHGDVFVGGYLYGRNEYDVAECHLRRVVNNPYAGILVRVSGITILARCLAAQGRYDEAEELIDRHLDHFLEADLTRFLWRLRASKVHIALMRGDIQAASRRVHELTVASDTSVYRGAEYPAILAAVTRLAEGTVYGEREAERIITVIGERSRSANSQGIQIQVLLMQALLDRRRNHDSAARSRIHEALTIAERGMYRRPLVELGSQFTELLRWYRDEGGRSRVLDELDLPESPGVVAIAAPESTNASTSSVPMRGDAAVELMEELTFREMDVLSALRRRLSNKEIAEELSISPLTVKSHTRSIYAKLGVNSRRQAIMRAASLRLVD